MEFTNIHKPLNLSGFEGEIAENSINYTSPSLEKGVLAESFGYNGSISTRVLGSEIKAGLTKIIAFAIKQENECSKTMSSALKDSKATPTASVGNYVTKGLDAFIPNVPKVFDHRTIESSSVEMRAKDQSYSYEANPMYRYNEAVKKYIEACVEKIYANAMLKGISESQYYYLNVRQATQVGIGS